jgi:hypothetical protein
MGKMSKHRQECEFFAIETPPDDPLQEWNA